MSRKVFTINSKKFGISGCVKLKHEMVEWIEDNDIIVCNLDVTATLCADMTWSYTISGLFENEDDFLLFKLSFSDVF